MLKNNNLIAIFVASLFVLIFLLYDACFIVKETEQSIVLRFGRIVTDKPLYAGLHFKVPFIEKIESFEKRILDVEAPSKEIIAGDQKRLIVSSFIKYKIVNPLLFFQSVRNVINLENKLQPVVESALRAEVGKISLYKLLNEYRSEVMKKILLRCKDDTANFGIEVIDFRIKKTDLPRENSKAVFMRMQTEREKEAKEIRARGEEESKKIRSSAAKEGKIILSEANSTAESIKGVGDAEAINIVSTILEQDKDFYEFYRSLEIYKASIGEKDKLFLSSGSPIFNTFNNSKATK